MDCDCANGCAALSPIAIASAIIHVPATRNITRLLLDESSVVRQRMLRRANTPLRCIGPPRRAPVTQFAPYRRELGPSRRLLIERFGIERFVLRNDEVPAEALADRTARLVCDSRM